ncbi:MAG: MBL fold metallo-hydrolase [Dysgonamonadaceae bacterium]
MKIVTLTDNSTSDPKLQTEHGLSVYIEFGDHKILFDTGKSDVFIKNAEALNIDLRQVTDVVISHGHYDHIGGLVSFLRINTNAKVYLKKEIFDYQYYSIKGTVSKKIGWSETLVEYKNRFIFLNNDFYIEDNLIFISNIEDIYPKPKGNELLYKLKEAHFELDDFRHELVFCLDTGNELCVFSGCSHNGITNMLYTIKKYFKDKKIKLIFGGLHLIDAIKFIQTETVKEINEIAFEVDYLSENAILFTGHCTSDKAKDIISKKMGRRFNTFYAGHVIELNTL